MGLEMLSNVLSIPKFYMAEMKCQLYRNLHRFTYSTGSPESHRQLLQGHQARRYPHHWSQELRFHPRPWLCLSEKHLLQRKYSSTEDVNTYCHFMFRRHKYKISRFLLSLWVSRDCLIDSFVADLLCGRHSKLKIIHYKWCKHEHLSQKYLKRLSHVQTKNKPPMLKKLTCL